MTTTPTVHKHVTAVAHLDGDSPDFMSYADITQDAGRSTGEGYQAATLPFYLGAMSVSESEIFVVRFCQ